MRVYRVVESPIGPLTLVGAVQADSNPRAGSVRLLSIGFSSAKTDTRLHPDAAPFPPPPDATPDQGALAEAARQLAAYFHGERQSFELALDPIGTPFQRRVWEELARIPYGKVISYRELAERVGSPGGVRAVGSANGRNPIPIVIPCHRVIASDGSLAGFGGGVPAKQFLLALEGIRIPSVVDQLAI